MPALIKFTVDDKAYAKVCYDIADTNKYISLISKSLLEDNNLSPYCP